jgi:hypothetical protein
MESKTVMKPSKGPNSTFDHMTASKESPAAMTIDLSRKSPKN